MSVSTQEIAQALLDIQAIGFRPQDPITFKTGLKSPVYVDNRRLPFHPSHWQTVLTGFREKIKEKNIELDVVAGIATAGIPHSAGLGLLIQKPSVFVRKESKGYGMQKRTEGGDVAGKRVLLIEDHVTTGSSSLSGVEALRSEGAIVTDCLVVTSYEFTEATENFSRAGVALHILTSFGIVLEEALKRGLFSEDDKVVIEDWLNDPHGWAERHL